MSQVECLGTCHQVNPQVQPQIEATPVILYNVDGQDGQISLRRGQSLVHMIRALAEEAGELFPIDGLVGRVLIGGEFRGVFITSGSDGNGSADAFVPLDFPLGPVTLQVVTDPQTTADGKTFTFEGGSNVIIAEILPQVVEGLTIRFETRDQEPVPFVNFTIARNDGTIVEQGVTAFNGEISLPNLAPGNYILEGLVNRFETEEGFYNPVVDISVPEDVTIRDAFVFAHTWKVTFGVDLPAWLNAALDAALGPLSPIIKLIANTIEDLASLALVPILNYFILTVNPALQGTGARIIGFKIDAENETFDIILEQKVQSPIIGIIAIIGSVIVVASIGVTLVFTYERITKNIADAEKARTLRTVAENTGKQIERVQDCIDRGDCSAEEGARLIEAITEANQRIIDALPEEEEGLKLEDLALPLIAGSAVIATAVIVASVLRK